ncbi:MAG: SGNH/GDSL hydrolase family protein [Nitrospirales bacterium]
MNIVCFGDSLTTGFQAPTIEVPYYQETPYGAFLQKWFGPRGTVIVRGVNGELTRDMVQRFARDVPTGSSHSVVILGGTNDLSAQVPTTRIIKNLARLYEDAQAAQIHPVAVTIPSLRIVDGLEGAEFLREHIARRLELNQLIMSHCRMAEIPCIDLFSETRDETSSQLATVYSNDGLHLSTDGYELLAQLLWDQVWANDFGARPRSNDEERCQ